MVSVYDVAGNIYHRYQKVYGERIDEMKLHKLMYFAQRESLIQNDEPLFNATFYGWKYGPVLKEIRHMYRTDSFEDVKDAQKISVIQPIVDIVFDLYAAKDSWSLSRLTHGETSWKNSRIGIAEDENSDTPIKIDDIRLDAAKVKLRRQLLAQL